MDLGEGGPANRQLWTNGRAFVGSGSGESTSISLASCTGFVHRQTWDSTRPVFAPSHAVGGRIREVGTDRRALNVFAFGQLYSITTLAGLKGACIASLR